MPLSVYEVLEQSSYDVTLIAAEPEKPKKASKDDGAAGETHLDLQEVVTDPETTPVTVPSPADPHALDGETDAAPKRRTASLSKKSASD